MLSKTPFLLRAESPNLSDYLADAPFLGVHSASITTVAESLFRNKVEALYRIEAAFLFVRDKIAHSLDIGSCRVTKNAEEVLRYREGLCFAQSMLLVALLRNGGIPAGFCYQRVPRPDGGYGLHGLTAVYIESHEQWVRLDARGNTNGKNAQFYPQEPFNEQLAFRLDDAVYSFPTIYVSPPFTILTLLQRYTTVQELLLALSSAL